MKGSLLRVVFAAAGLGLLASAAVAEERRFMTLEEIKATIIGNTMTGKTPEGQGFAEFYASDGVIRGGSGGKKYTGRWWLREEDDLMCFRYGEGAFEAGCVRLALTGDRVDFVLLDGTVEPPATLVKDNPRSL